MKHNSPPPRAIELIGGIAASWWGVVVLLWGDRKGLSWAGFDFSETQIVAASIIAGGILVALGAHLNGRWKYSPALRTLGLVCVAGIMWLLAIAGASVAGSAFATYYLLAVGVTVAAAFALIDTIAALRGSHARV